MIKIIKHRFILFAVILFQLSAIDSLSQNIKLFKPNDHIESEKNFYYTDGDEIMAIKRYDKDLFIQKFSLEANKEISLKTTSFTDRMAPSEVLEFGGKYLVFYWEFDTQDRSEDLFYQEIDFKSGDLKGKPVEFFSSSLRLEKWRMNKQRFLLKTSHDNKKLLICYHLQPETGSRNEPNDKIGFCVFNEDLTIDWNKVVEMPYERSYMENIDFAVNKDGEVYGLIRVDKDRVSNLVAGALDRADDLRKSLVLLNKDPNYQRHQILKITKTQKMYLQTELDAGNIFVSKINIYDGANGGIICAGLYNDRWESDEWSGIFMQEVNCNQSVSILKTHPYTKEVLTEYESKKTANKRTKKVEKGHGPIRGIKNYSVEPMFDGTSILIAEEVSISGSQQTSNGSGSMPPKFYYQDIIVTKTNAQGDLIWMVKIPKNQYAFGSAPSGLSFKYVQIKNEHFFLFMDDPKNLNLNKEEEPLRHKNIPNGILASVKLDHQTGDMSKNSIGDINILREAGMQIIKMKNVGIISENQFFIEYSKKDKEDQISVFTID